jgi:hypothetical protein
MHHRRNAEVQFSTTVSGLSVGTAGPMAREDRCLPVQVSARSWRYPQWRRDGNGLYYVNSERRMAAVSVKTDPAVRMGPETVLFDAPFEISSLAAPEAFLLQDGRATARACCSRAGASSPASSGATGRYGASRQRKGLHERSI